MCDISHLAPASQCTIGRPYLIGSRKTSPRLSFFSSSKILFKTDQIQDIYTFNTNLMYKENNVSVVMTLLVVHLRIVD